VNTAVRIAVSFFLCLVPFASTFALDRDLSLKQLHHTAWTFADGAPADVTALAQTPDGYLWLGTTSGLFRFDGERFERYRPPNADATADAALSRYVMALMALSDGTLWIGFRYSGAARLLDGVLTAYGEKEGLPPGHLRSFARDLDGVIWAASAGGLARFDGRAWEAVGKSWRFPSNYASAVFVDKEGTLWAAAESTIVKLARGARTFEETGAKVGQVPRIGAAPDGKLWIAETTRSVHTFDPVLGERDPKFAELRFGAVGFLFDRDGVLWVPTIGDGLRRVANPAALGGRDEAASAKLLESFVQNDGLSADYIYASLEDREGTIWLGTTMGLDRFRNNRVIETALPDVRHHFSLAARPGSGVFAGSSSHSVLDVRVGSARDIPDSPANVGAIARAKDGTFWFGAFLDLQRFANGRYMSIAYPSDEPNATVSWITTRADGSVWLGLHGRGMYSWKDGAWTHIPAKPGWPTQDSLTEFTDAADAMWIGYPDHCVVRVSGDDAHVYSSADGIDVGDIKAVHGRDGRVWIGGPLGVNLLDQDHFRPLRSTGNEALRGITGIVQARDHTLWLAGARGIVRISAEDVEKIASDPSHTATITIFDALDGLRSPLQSREPYPSIVEADDGVMWFATNDGIVHVDPRRIATNTPIPPISIVSLSADKQTFDPSEMARLPAGTREIKIAYTALSLSMPERVRFRHRIEGMHDGWQDGGSLREVSYSNPTPGRYRFDVTASNNDGVWNTEGASVAFEVLPGPLQTWWFRLLVIVAGIALLTALYFWRLRIVTQRMRLTMEATLVERERIARDLHDTLLQGLQGLILQLQVAAVSLPRQEKLDSALTRAQQMLIEGRDRIVDLRSGKASIEQMLQTTASEFASTRTALAASSEGSPRSVHAAVHDELVAIGREAVRNAFAHASANRIDVRVRYGTDALTLEIADDGVGIDGEKLARSAPSGHWGLVGMRERAEKLHAKLQLKAREPSGTEVIVSVPARIAYADSGSGWRRWLRVVSR